jgi:hypothetical protein
MSLQERIAPLYFDALLSTDGGRSYVLSQCAEAEATDEGAVFDRLLTKVDDAELRTLIRKHQEDELRHARLFRECMDRLRVEPTAIPEGFQLLPRLDRHLGGVMQRPIESREDVMTSYVVLQVIEERAATQFPMLVTGFRKIDPHVADVIAGIARDEDRHLKYCQAIAKRYAPDPLTHREALVRVREVEARAFAEHARANMQRVRASGYLGGGPMSSLFWSAVGAFASAFRRSQPTKFWRELPAAA